MANREYYTQQMLVDEQFVQMPKWLMMDTEFSKMSSDAKILYMILKDRFKLSYKNKWYDKNGHVYIICKRDTMCQLLNKSKNTVTTIVNELIKYNLIEEKKNGQGKPNYIYLLMPEFSDPKEEEFDEDNYIDDQNDDKSQNPKNWESENTNIGNLKSQKLSTNKSNLNKTKNINSYIYNNSNNLKDSKAVVDKKFNENEFYSVIFTSRYYKTCIEVGGETLKTANYVAKKICDLIKRLNSKKQKIIASLSPDKIENIFNLATTAYDNAYNTFDNPDGYIMSQINNAIEDCS